MDPLWSRLFLSILILCVPGVDSETCFRLQNPPPVGSSCEANGSINAYKSPYLINGTYVHYTLANSSLKDCIQLCMEIEEKSCGSFSWNMTNSTCILNSLNLKQLNFSPSDLANKNETIWSDAECYTYTNNNDTHGIDTGPGCPLKCEQHEMFCGRECPKFSNGTINWDCGACINPQSDNMNCARCGLECPRGFRCVSGKCSCDSPDSTKCNGHCVDTYNDPDNCGGCGITCAKGERCWSDFLGPACGKDRPPPKHCLADEDCQTALSPGCQCYESLGFNGTEGPYKMCGNRVMETPPMACWDDLRCNKSGHFRAQCGQTPNTTDSFCTNYEQCQTNVSYTPKALPDTSGIKGICDGVTPLSVTPSKSNETVQLPPPFDAYNNCTNKRGPIGSQTSICELQGFNKYFCPIANFTSPTLISCRQFCLAFPECESFSFTKATLSCLLYGNSVWKQGFKMLNETELAGNLTGESTGEEIINHAIRSSHTPIFSDRDCYSKDCTCDGQLVPSPIEPTLCACPSNQYRQVNTNICKTCDESLLKALTDPSICACPDIMIQMAQLNMTVCRTV